MNDFKLYSLGLSESFKFLQYIINSVHLVIQRIKLNQKSHSTLQLAQLIDDTSQPPNFTEIESEYYKGFSVL